MRTAASVTAGALLAVALLLAALPVPAGAGAFRLDFVGEGRSDDIETMDVGGTTYFRLADLARAVGAVRHWNPLTGKATLRVNGHSIAVSAESPFARCDDGIRNLRRPALRADAEFWVPPAYLTDALAWALDADVSIDAETGVVGVAKRRAMVLSAAIEGATGGTVLVLGLSQQARFSADDTGDALLVLVRDSGLSDSLTVPGGEGLITGVTVERVRSGVLVTAHLADDAGGYGTELLADPHRIEIVVEQGATGSSRAARQSLAAAGRSPDAHGVDHVIDTVVLDPGHGGSDAGAWGPSGLAEKDVNLAFAQDLGRALEKEGFHVLFTRESDEAVPLKRRAEVANLAVADLFVSVHANGWHEASASGVQVSSRAPTPRSRSRVRPRPAQGTAGTTRWESVQDPFVPLSRGLAGAIRDRVAAAMPWASRGARTGDLAVLSGCAMPAVMVEIGFITNPGDEAKLASEEWRRDLARSIAKGVSDFRADMMGRRL